MLSVNIPFSPRSRQCCAMIASFIRIFDVKLRSTALSIVVLSIGKYSKYRECRSFFVLVWDSSLLRIFWSSIVHLGDDDRIDCKGIPLINQCQQFIPSHRVFRHISDIWKDQDVWIDHHLHVDHNSSSSWTRLTRFLLRICAGFFTASTNGSLSVVFFKVMVWVFSRCIKNVSLGWIFNASFTFFRDRLNFYRSALQAPFCIPH